MRLSNEILTGVITLLILGIAPIRSFGGVISRVISPVISSYYFP